MKSYLDSSLGKALSPHKLFLFNQTCLLCKQYSGEIICSVCYRDMIKFIKQTAPISNPLLSTIRSNIKCESLTVLGQYNWPLHYFIHLLKFKQSPQFAQLLSNWFVQYRLGKNDLPDGLIAIPANPLSYFIRGYNPPKLLAQYFSKKLGIVHLDNHIVTKFRVLPQHYLNRKQRLNRKFNLTCLPIPKHIKHLAIVDDVVTTGSTMAAAVRSIKKTNPNIYVSCWVIAYTPA